MDKSEKRDIRKVEHMIGKSISSRRERGREKARSAKMGGGMMKRNVAMKKGGKIPPQLKKFIMAKKKKAKMKKKK